MDFCLFTVTRIHNIRKRTNNEKLENNIEECKVTEDSRVKRNRNRVINKKVQEKRKAGAQKKKLNVTSCESSIKTTFEEHVPSDKNIALAIHSGDY